MIEYIVDEEKYRLNYSELREEYVRHVKMSNKKFMKNLPSALHLTCVIHYLKETPSYLILKDTGLLHELIHLLHHGETEFTNLKKIRKLFKKYNKLSY